MSQISREALKRRLLALKNGNSNASNPNASKPNASKPNVEGYNVDQKDITPLNVPAHGNPDPGTILTNNIRTNRIINKEVDAFKNSFKDKPDWTKKYDIQRRGIRETGNVNRDKIAEQVAKNLSSKGFKKGSGFSEAAQLYADTSSRKDEANQLTGVTLQELSDAEKRDYFTFTTDYNQNILQKNNIDKMKSDSYYNKGIAGEELSGAELSYLEEHDPLGYYAYQAGISGKSREDFVQDRDAKLSARNALLLNAGPDDIEAIIDIFEGYGVDIPEELKTKMEETRIASVNEGKSIDLKGHYRKKDSNNQQNFGTESKSGKTTRPDWFNQIKPGAKVTIAGKKYTVKDGVSVNYDTGATKEYEMFTVTDSNGNLIYVVPSGLNIKEVADELGVSRDQVIGG